jgi:hypothetical protein
MFQREGRFASVVKKHLPSKTVGTEGSLKVVQSEIFRKVKEGVTFFPWV